MKSQTKIFCGRTNCKHNVATRSYHFCSKRSVHIEADYDRTEYLGYTCIDYEE